jgi:transposase
LYVGVDVAATTFPATWSQPHTVATKPVTLPQTPAGYQRVHQHRAATGTAPQHTLVVLEATGSAWVARAVALHHAAFAVSVVHPTQVHNGAKSLPRRSKTDA